MPKNSPAIYPKINSGVSVLNFPGKGLKGAFGFTSIGPTKPTVKSNPIGFPPFKYMMRYVLKLSLNY